MNSVQLDDLSFKIIGAAIEVHRRMGPGLFENIYEDCLMVEFELRNIKAQRQIEIPLTYKGRELPRKYILDILVEDEIILELKAVSELHDIHIAQLVSYLKLTNKRLGLLMNFHEPILKSGVKRIVNNF